jgi:hypothetical protein
MELDTKTGLPTDRWPKHDFVSWVNLARGLQLKDDSYNRSH